jgi:hypothetical protein
VEIRDISIKIDSELGGEQNSILMAWSQKLIAAGRARRRPLDNAADHGKCLHDAGFKEIECTMFKWPIKGLTREIFYFGAEALSMRLLTEIGDTEEDVRNECERVKKFLLSPAACKGHFINAYGVPSYFVAFAIAN